MNGVGYNSADAGNYMWGYAMRVMGFSELAARAAAHVNAWYSGKTSNGEGSIDPNSFKKWFKDRTWTGDSAEDQKAIKRGMRDAGSYWKYKKQTMKGLFK